MPLVYADTSALFAFFHPRDEFSQVVTDAVLRSAPDFVYWSFLRYELRHNLRQSRTDSDGEVAWKALRAGERTHARLRWQSDLRAESVIEAADELSAQSALASKSEAPTSCMWQPRGACICSLAWTSSGPATPSKGLWHPPRG